MQEKFDDNHLPQLDSRHTSPPKPNKKSAGEVSNNGIFDDNNNRQTENQQRPRLQSRDEDIDEENPQSDSPQKRLVFLYSRQYGFSHCQWTDLSKVATKLGEKFLR